MEIKKSGNAISLGGILNGIALPLYYPTKTTKERIVLVYAWNELGEGGDLLPAKGDPEASYP